MKLSAVFLIALSPIVSFSADRLSVGLTATHTSIEAVSVPGTSPDPPVIALSLPFKPKAMFSPLPTFGSVPVLCNALLTGNSITRCGGAVVPPCEGFGD